MKKCHKCGVIWQGFGRPRARQICENCGSYLHSCLNCHHFDNVGSYSCKLQNTTFIGSRDSLNYCDQFEMVNWDLRAVEARTERARSAFENLFGASMRSQRAAR